MKHQLFPEDELGPGELRAARIDGISIVVIRDPEGGYHALRDSCSHHGAPLSQGSLQQVIVGDDVGRYEFSESQLMVRCPWHGYEFDVETGQCLADPRQARVRAYPVTVENGIVFVERKR